jgi:hypothetical protein
VGIPLFFDYQQLYLRFLGILMVAIAFNLILFFLKVAILSLMI